MQGSESTVLVSVADTGSGVSAEDLAHFLGRFYRSGSRARNTREADLGLPIARELVIAHDGEIRVQSTPGDGTTVTVELLRILPAGR